MSDAMFVFVYGTLKRSGRLHANLERIHAEYVGDAIIMAELYSLGWYPGIKSHRDGIPSPFEEGPYNSEAVRGELFLLRDESSLKTLDAVEGAPHLFERRLVDAWTENGPFAQKVWTYFYQGAVKERDRIASGVWSVEIGVTA